MEYGEAGAKNMEFGLTGHHDKRHDGQPVVVFKHALFSLLQFGQWSASQEGVTDVTARAYSS